VQEGWQLLQQLLPEVQQEKEEVLVQAAGRDLCECQHLLPDTKHGL
jgi:hypothetical protein